MNAPPRLSRALPVEVEASAHERDLYKREFEAETRMAAIIESHAGIFSTTGEALIAALRDDSLKCSPVHSDVMYVVLKEYDHLCAVRDFIEHVMQKTTVTPEAPETVTCPAPN